MKKKTIFKNVRLPFIQFSQNRIDETHKRHYRRNPVSLHPLWQFFAKALFYSWLVSDGVKFLSTPKTNNEGLLMKFQRSRKWKRRLKRGMGKGGKRETGLPRVKSKQTLGMFEVLNGIKEKTRESEPSKKSQISRVKVKK